MNRTAAGILFLGLITATGCVDEQSSNMHLVPANPFGTTALPKNPGPLTPASTQAAARVDLMGRKILAANGKIGLKPVFRTIGAPKPEIFHRGTTEILVTEGLVNQCPSDGQLAAVLSYELGKMVSEREILASSAARRPERDPPMDIPVGNDQGSFGPADQTRRAELAPLDAERKQRNQPLVPPDPQVLAQNYLTQAGYTPADMEAAVPILNAAGENLTFERLGKPSPTPARSWKTW